VLSAAVADGALLTRGGACNTPRSEQGMLASARKRATLGRILRKPDSRPVVEGPRVKNRSFLAILVGVAALVPTVGRADGPLDPPSGQAVKEAREIVDAMKREARGPYLRLRWFCNDGSVHPPRPYPCAERGGGIQHAEYSPPRERLAALGWHGGTIVAALTWDELWDAEHRQARLRELALERYLVDVDDGWVLRQARSYRGRIQVEDEEAKGRELLARLLGQREWVSANFLAARESVRAIPHHGLAGDRTREVRRISKTIAERDASFEPLRVKIHNEPGREDIDAVRAWLGRTSPDARVRTDADELLVQMEAIYGERARAGQFAAAASQLRAEGRVAMADLLEKGATLPARERAEANAHLLSLLRDAVEASESGSASLGLLDLSIDVESQAVEAAFEALKDGSASRGDLLAFGAVLADGAYGTGFLSSRERDDLVRQARELGTGDAGTPEYLAAARALERAANWAIGSVRHGFAEPLVRYAALEPAANRFVDDLIRGSLMLPLAEVGTRLARDAERQSGLLHVVFGRELAGMAGLNPGATVGRLRILDDADVSGVTLSPEEIVVLPATSKDLTPIAGILTVSEGNALSHVQMLARNLGIPNAVVPLTAMDALREHAGQQVLYAVTPGGSVVLSTLSDSAPDLIEQVRGAKRAELGQKVAAPLPDLSIQRLLLQSELHAGVSGKLVGPKAAYAGELARHFPGRVAPSIAIPFGIYALHAASGEDSLKSRLDRSFARWRAGEIDDAALYADVEAMRVAVEALAVRPETVAELDRVMKEVFGPPGTYGVFVRSDTNVEDLPLFTGAGLNRTLPNVIGFDAQMAAIPMVWASPFTARAMAWRIQALTNPEEVYPSVLLMKSMPSEKSGVLVTRDVVTGGEGVTVAAAWGPGAAVENEISETVVLRPDGRTVLVSEAKAPYKRRLAAKGGTEWVPAATGRVLTDAELGELRQLAAAVNEKLVPEVDELGRPLPWDVEFGFVDGRMWLFQARPLVERGGALADKVVRALAPGRSAGSPTTPLGVAPGSPATRPRPRS
jgi:hypothetical protein